MLNGNGTHLIDLKFCCSCNIIKPPGCSPASAHRTVHCSVCDTCILEFDHHCPWLSTCIGKNNFAHFAYLLPTLIILILLNLCAIFLSSNIGLAMKCILAIYLSPFLGGICYHTWFNWTKVISPNQSTYEAIKQSYSSYFIKPNNSNKNSKEYKNFYLFILPFFVF